MTSEAPFASSGGALACGTRRHISKLSHSSPDGALQAKTDGTSFAGPVKQGDSSVVFAQMIVQELPVAERGNAPRADDREVSG
jgi:hypothetical protein